MVAEEALDVSQSRFVYAVVFLPKDIYVRNLEVSDTCSLNGNLLRVFRFGGWTHGYFEDE